MAIIWVGHGPSGTPGETELDCYTALANYSSQLITIAISLSYYNI